MKTCKTQWWLGTTFALVVAAELQVLPVTAEEPKVDVAKSAVAEKRITVDFKATPLKEACASLSKDTGLPITCGSAFDMKPVTLSLRDAKLDQVLGEIAKQTGTYVNAKDGGFRFRHSAK